MALQLEATVSKMDKLVTKLAKAMRDNNSDSLRLPQVVVLGEYKVAKSSLSLAVKRYNNSLLLSDDEDARELDITLRKQTNKAHYLLVAEYTDTLDNMIDAALEDAIYGNSEDTDFYACAPLTDDELALAREQLMAPFYVLDASPAEVIAKHYIYDVGVLLEPNTNSACIETLLVTFEMEAREHYLSMNQKPLDDIMPILITYKDGQRLVKFTPPDEVDNYVKAENVSAVVGADKRPEGSDGTVTAA